MPRKKNEPENVAYRSIKVPIYPTEEQEHIFSMTFGCKRFYWNQALADEKANYEATGEFEIKQPAYYKDAYPFLREVDSLALANAWLDLLGAFRRFFNKSAGFPRFKSKKNKKQSYSTTCLYKKGKDGNVKPSNIWIEDGGIRLPKVGVVKANLYRQPMPGWKMKSVTVSKTGSGKYFCSMLFEFETQPVEPVTPTEETTIGLDYSSPKFYVDDKGNSPQMEHFFRKSEEKLARLQQKQARCVKGSNHYKKMERKIQLLHEHIANQRKDFTHKLSREIANSYDAVCLEDIDLRNMAQSLKFGKSTNDNGFGMFRKQLKYKLTEQGKQYIVIGKWFPSSKTCNRCGHVNANLKLGEMEWECPCCHRLIDRDINAARNIKAEGLRIFFSEGITKAS